MRSLSDPFTGREAEARSEEGAHPGASKELEALPPSLCTSLPGGGQELGLFSRNQGGLH